MKEADRPILAALRDSGFALTPRDIIYNLDTRYDIEISESTFYRRAKVLAYAGLITKEDPEGGRYAITEKGERLLDEDLSDEEVSDVSQMLQEGPD